MLHIVSPHIDDAFLSIGGIISLLKAKNIEITISYIFTVSKWVNSEACDVSQYKNNTQLVTSVRKAEEALLGSKLDYEYLFLDFEDSSLRVLHTANDGHLSTQIEDKLLDILNKEDIIFFPLGIGHVDHLLVREIGLNLLKKGYKIIVYEDLPYAAFAHFDYEDRYKFIIDNNFTPYCMEINMEEKISALKLYSTQMSHSWLKDLKNYSYSLNENKFYERFWQPTQLTGNLLENIMSTETKYESS